MRDCSPVREFDRSTLKKGDVIANPPYVCHPGGGGFAFTATSVAFHVGGGGARAGEELFLDYAHRPNDHWLLYYGFLPSANRHNAVTLDDGSLVSWPELPLPSGDRRRSFDLS